MNLGSPVVFGEGSEQRQFVTLAPISVRRDDPNSFDEKLLQELIHASPNILPARDYLPTTKALFSLGREVQVDLGGKQGLIDNLLVTNDGYLVIVETKLYRNPEGIREVIAQTLQYGMAVGAMSLTELEARIKGGQSPALIGTENVGDAVLRQVNERKLSAGWLTDYFEEALEVNLRRGELLLLIVSDRIHAGVERVTDWLNGQKNSTPFKLGLVELKFYSHGEERVVVPRTVLKTREISRHVVVVDIRPKMDVSTTTEVTDEFTTTAGGKTQESRSVKSASTPMTKTRLLQLIAPPYLPVVSPLIDMFESYGFDSRGTGTYLQFGFTYPPDGGDFHPLAYLGTAGVWASALKALRQLAGAEGMLSFHREANKFGPFYRHDQLCNPDSTGSEVKYPQIQESVSGFVAFLDTYRSAFIRLLEAEDSS